MKCGEAERDVTVNSLDKDYPKKMLSEGKQRGSQEGVASSSK